MSRILVAMSGGVDSSVAAALLVEQGHDVTGVHLKVADEMPSRSEGGRVHGCCSVEDADDARRVAQVLDIPFYVWNLAEMFRAAVVDDFVAEYGAGRTPNPCVRCNERVKFGAVLDRGIALGFDFVATGHYAVVRHEPDGPRLFRGTDAAKDQSYVLATVGRDALARSLFPLGDRTKPEVREVARRLGLRTADKPESYDICFVQDGDAAAFVERHAPAAPGPILDEHGHEIGEHRGIHRFTVGQRRGLGLALHEPRYVLAVDPARNAIVVGPGELLSRRRIDIERTTWLRRPSRAEAVHVQIRAHATPVPASVERDDGSEASIRLLRPERGIAPGQLAAVYQEDEVLGGGTIAAAG